MSASAEQFDVIDGGCQCSLVRYRVTLPQNGAKILVGGKEYPYANHCNCTICAKVYSTLTQTFFNIPLSCIQFATRVPYDSQPQSQNCVSRSISQLASNELPPSYAASSIGSSPNWTPRRLSTSSTASSSSETTITSISTMTSASSVSTVPTMASSSSSSGWPSASQRGTSLIEVVIPTGCCTSATAPSLTAIAPVPTSSPMLVTPPRPASYSSLAAEARRNPQAATRASGSHTSSSNRTTPTMARVSHVGGGVENPYFASPSSSGTAGKKPVSPHIFGETINPLAAVTPPLRRVVQNSLQSTSSASAPPSYSTHTRMQQLTIPWPYKEYPLSDSRLRGFCGYCGGGLLVRQSFTNEEGGVIALATGSMDYPEKVLGIEGIFDNSSKECSNGNGDEGRLKLLKEWGLALGEGKSVYSLST